MKLYLSKKEISSLLKGGADGKQTPLLRSCSLGIFVCHFTRYLAISLVEVVYNIKATSLSTIQFLLVK